MVQRRRRVILSCKENKSRKKFKVVNSNQEEGSETELC